MHQPHGRCRGRRHSMHRLRHLALVAVLTVAAACYQYRVAAPGPVSPGVTEPKGEVLWSFIWGLVQEYPRVDNCQGQGMAEVKASTNLGFVLLTVVTLGLASPMQVEWRCAPPTPPEGRIPPAATEAEPVAIPPVPLSGGTAP